MSDVLLSAYDGEKCTACSQDRQNVGIALEPRVSYHSQHLNIPHPLHCTCCSKFHGNRLHRRTYKQQHAAGNATASISSCAPRQLFPQGIRVCFGGCRLGRRHRLRWRWYGTVSLAGTHVKRFKAQGDAQPAGGGGVEYSVSNCKVLCSSAWPETWAASNQGLRKRGCRRDSERISSQIAGAQFMSQPKPPAIGNTASGACLTYWSLQRSWRLRRRTPALENLPMRHDHPIGCLAHACERASRRNLRPLRGRRHPVVACGVPDRHRHGRAGPNDAAPSRRAYVRRGPPDLHRLKPWRDTTQ